MAACVVCGRPAGGAAIVDPDSGDALHGECLADRIVPDAAGVVIAVLATTVARTVVLWAG